MGELRETITIKQAAETFQMTPWYWQQAAQKNRYTTPDGNPVWWKVGSDWRAYKDELEDSIRRTGKDAETKD